MRRFATLVLVALLVVAAVAGWFVLNLYQLADTVRAEDVDGFTARVDLPAVRSSLARQVVAQAGAGNIRGLSVSLDPAGQTIAANLIAAQLESAITPEMVFTLLRSGALRDDGAGPGTGTRSADDAPFALPANPLARLKGFGIGLPAKIRLTVGDGDDPAAWLTLAFSLRGLTWTVTDVILPDRAFRQLGRAMRQELRGGG